MLGPVLMAVLGISASDCAAYRLLWREAGGAGCGSGAMLAANTAAAFFRRSGVKDSVLRAVWRAVYVTGREVSERAFYSALKLIARVRVFFLRTLFVRRSRKCN